MGPDTAGPDRWVHNVAGDTDPIPIYFTRRRPHPCTSPKNVKGWGLTPQGRALLEATCKALKASSRHAELVPDACLPFIEHLADRSGILVPEGDHWRFRHRTFVEYLAAWAVCDLADDPARLLAEKITDPAWHEVTLLAHAHTASGARARAKAMLTVLLQAVEYLPTAEERANAYGRAAAAAIDLRAYAVDGLAEAVKAYKPKWIELIEDVSTPGSVDARWALGDALGWFGDPRIGWSEAHFCAVPAGTVTTGPVDDEYWSEAWKPWLSERREMELPAFRIARHLVTSAQFREFVESGEMDDPRWWTAGPRSMDGWKTVLYWMHRAPPNRPVIYVDWFEANAFCAWASARYAPDGVIYRLPTSVEWERAARGADLRPFPWGDKTPDEIRTNCEGVGFDDTSAVGLFPAGAGPFGTLDHAGNVWDWCVDRRDWVHGSNHRVVRGGAFGFVPRTLRVAFRGASVPHMRFAYIGFRCVCVRPEDPLILDP